MIIDLLNFNRYYPGTEANILFRMQEEGISVAPFFCITEDFNEDELNSYLQNHFQYTEFFFIKLSFSFENHSNDDITNAAAKLPLRLNIPKSALAYSAEKLFSQANDFVKNNYPDEDVRKYLAAHIIVQEAIDADFSGCLHTACRAGLLNETIIFLGEPYPIEYTDKDIVSSIYCHNNTDGILFAHEPEGAVKASIDIVKRTLELSEKIKKIFNNTALEINFIVNMSINKIYIVSLSALPELELSNEDEIILDTRGVCNYYPGVTEPLYASTASEMSAHIINKMLSQIGHSSSLPDSEAGIIEYVNGRLYFNTKKLLKLQEMLFLTDESDKFIEPSLKNIAPHIKESGGLRLWIRKRRSASKFIKLLEENLKQSKLLCDKCRESLNELSSGSVEQDAKNTIKKILSAISECISSNQLNTIYININRRITSRLRPTEKKYAKAENSIAMALLYREELRRYHYSFIKFLRLHTINLGNQLVQKGIVENQTDISMLKYEELFLNDVSSIPDIKDVIHKRKTEFEWYKSMPNFSRLVFNKQINNAPVGKVDYICAVSEKSHIRGCGLNMEKAEFPAVICKDSILPEQCDPEKIYVVDRFTDFSEKMHIGGLIIMQQPILANMNPDLIKVRFPIICGAEHALSVIKNGDLISMNSSNGEIYIEHIK